MFLLLVSETTKAELMYAITLDNNSEAYIKKKDKCNGDISNGGGDFVEHNFQLRGKCGGAGLAPDIIKDQLGDRFIQFSTDPTYKGKTKTRTELALTRQWFSFHKPMFIGFKLQIPTDSDVTNEFFYLMQFWQCAPNSPIAGIRLDRGTSHTINFMTRGDSRAASMAKYSLKPGEWHSFILKATVDPTGKAGEFSVWDSPDKPPKIFNGAFGYAKKNCKGLKDIPQRFRLKFGIYKGNENDQIYKVGYDDIRIGDTFEDVSPWSR